MSDDSSHTPFVDQPGSRTIRRGGRFEDVGRIVEQSKWIGAGIFLALVVSVLAAFSWYQSLESWMAQGSPDILGDKPLAGVFANGFVLILSLVLLGIFFRDADRVTKFIVICTAIFVTLVSAFFLTPGFVWIVFNDPWPIAITFGAFAVDVAAYIMVMGFKNEIQDPLPTDDSSVRKTIENNEHEINLWHLNEGSQSEAAHLREQVANLEFDLNEALRANEKLAEQKDKEYHIGKRLSNGSVKNIKGFDLDADLLNRFLWEGQAGRRGFTRTAWVGRQSELNHGNSIPKAQWKALYDALTHSGTLIDNKLVGPYEQIREDFRLPQYEPEDV